MGALSKSTASKDQHAKFTIYETEGVRYYVMVNMDDRVCKVFHLQDGRYIKLADAANETLEFDLGKCRIAFDFSRIWPK